MKTWEALKAADEGKKIRRKWWAKGIYSVKTERPCFGGTALVTHFGSKSSNNTNYIKVGVVDWDEVFADDWEIYEEGKNERTDKSFAK